MANKVVSDDDIIQDVCERGLRLAERTGMPLSEAINNQAFWRPRELCGDARRKARECQSITDIIGNNTPDDDEGDDWASASESMFPCAEPGYENIERIDLLDRLHEGLKQHLVDVAKLHSQGFSLREIAEVVGTPQGTTQYHWESYLRHVREID